MESLDSRPPPSRRRDKAQRSCDFCRKRKLRCDRKEPCGTCSSRGQLLACIYPAPTIRKRPPAPSTSIQSRLNQLETLVNSMIAGLNAEDSEDGTAPASSHIALDNAMQAKPGDNMNRDLADVKPIHSEPGKISVSPSGTTYASSSHWSSILESITDLKGIFVEHDDSLHQPSSAAFVKEIADKDTPTLFFGCCQPHSRDELLRAPPERREADHLIFAYFNYFCHPFGFVHSTSFLQQYHEFWQDHNKPPLGWLGLLFSIMCLVSQTQPSGDMEPAEEQENVQSYTSPRPPRPKYLDQVTQCLVLCDYGNGGPYVLETLMHYIIIESIRWPDSKGSNCVLFGMIVRLAHRMGYHRDPSHFPKISPFQGEMRRRVWASIYCMDVIQSLQMGLPRTINDAQCDTQPPRNILDIDFDETSTEPLKSRPDHEVTPMLHALAKRKVLAVLAQIVDWALQTETAQESNPRSAKDWETQLRCVFEDLPDKTKYISVSHYLFENPRDILNRLTTAILLPMGLILLYRQYVVSASVCALTGTLPNDKESGEVESEATVHAVQTCVDASLQLLEYQNVVESEVQPRATLHSLRKMINSAMSQGFLMATVVLSVYILRVAASCQRQRAGHPKLEANRNRIQLILSTLRCTYQAWLRHSTHSSEARRMADLLTFLFRRLDILESYRSEAGDEKVVVSNLIQEYQDFDLDCDWISFDELASLGNVIGGDTSFLQTNLSPGT